MQEKSRKRSSRRVRKGPGLDFGPRNYQLFGIGILVIILGYAFMTKGPADSFLSLTLSPLLLVIAYCLIIPAAILYRPKTAAAEQTKEQGTK